jgi:hypothetical protein
MLTTMRRDQLATERMTNGDTNNPSAVVKIRRRACWLALVLLSAIVALLVVILTVGHAPQTITLPNGEQYRFFAAAWCTNDLKPPLTFAARIVSHLPTPAANFIKTKWGDRLALPPIVGVRGNVFYGPGWMPYTMELEPPPEPSLHVWLRQSGTSVSQSSPEVRVFLTGDNGLASAGVQSGISLDPWMEFRFPLVSRRSAWLTLHWFEDGSTNELGAVTFRNPLFGRFPQLEPEVLPLTKTNGDLAVRLIDFAVRDSTVPPMALTGETKSGERRFDGDQGIFRLEMHSSRGTNEGWYFHKVELSDATGNRVRLDYVHSYFGHGGYAFCPLLAFEEQAWRLRLELKRFRGFEADEFVTFTNVPLPAPDVRSVRFQTNKIRGVSMILKQEIWRRPLATQLKLELLGKPADMAANIHSLVANTGWKPDGYSNPGDEFSSTVFLDPVPDYISTVDVIWTVQKTRSFEFLVKPVIRSLDPL